jgi:trimeric autotransporter adhesin
MSTRPESNSAHHAAVRRRARARLLLVAVCVPVLAVGLFALARASRGGPLHAAYLRYSKWRYHWKAPDDIGSGGSALAALIEDPVGIGEDAAGNVYVTDRADHCVWKIDAAGRATVIAGSGMGGLETEGLPATESKLNSPEGLVVNREGEVLFVDSISNEVVKIDRQGRLYLVAGNGKPGFGGDGGQASRASLAYPYDIRLDSRGNIFVADFGNHRIRKIDRGGVITTVAGTGVAGYSGDGGPATSAQLNGPYGVFLDAEDNLLIADSQNHVIRRVGRDGLITTVAGSGQPGYAGDGGQARAAKFDTPQSLFVDAQGRLYVGDEHNHAVRVIERDGTIRTLIGNGRAGFAGDGQQAASAALNDPENIWIRKDGSVLITDGDNGRVRRIAPDGVVSTFAGSGVSPDHVARLFNLKRSDTHLALMRLR